MMDYNNNNYVTPISKRGLQLDPTKNLIKSLESFNGFSGTSEFDTFPLRQIFLKEHKRTCLCVYI